MINDHVDLDRVLGQYDPGKVLVGPLRNLSINSSFRFFYVAGNGGKVYQSIGLGFIDSEPDAERERDDVIAKLQSHFGEVKVLNDPLEMAGEANRLWPNEETDRFFATAALEAKLQPAQVGGPEETASNDIGALPNNQCESAVDEAPAQSTSFGDALGSILSARLASTPAHELSTSASHRPVEPVRLPDAGKTWPLNGDPTITPRSRHAALELDDVALAVLRLKSVPETGANTAPATASLANAEASVDQPIKQSGRSPSIIYRFCAISGAAAIMAGIVVVTSTRYTGKEASPAASIAQAAAADSDNHSSQTTGSVLLSNPQDKIAIANETPPQAGQAARSPGPVAQTDPSPAASAQNEPPQRPQIGAPSLQVASAQVDARPVSKVQSPSSAEAGPGLAQSPPAPHSGTQVDTPAVSERQASPVTQVDPHAASAAEASASQADGTAVATTRTEEPESRPSAAAIRIATGSASGGATASQTSGRATEQVGASTASAAPVLKPESGPSPVIGAPVATGRALADAHDRDGVASASPPKATARMANTEVGSPPFSTAVAPILQGGGKTAKPLRADELDALLGRSNNFVRDGDFAAARILLRRAAESGSADAALMLGKTFDPLYLRELGAMGIQPDIAQARHWYQKAVELGSDAAAQRLSNLASGRGQ